VALQAEYYTVSGKLLKTASFEYANSVEYRGRPQLFVSKLTIRDALNQSNYSVLEYSDVQLRTFAPAEFTVAALTE
jgi:hypothetical protein